MQSRVGKLWEQQSGAQIPLSQPQGISKAAGQG